MEPRTVVRRLAEWSTGLTFDAIPEDVRDAARTCLIDTLGVALAGTRTRASAIARDLAHCTAATGDATVLGTSGRLAAPAAAFANAVAAHALDFDDNCYAGIVHGSAIVMPAALAATEANDGTGASFLTAFVAGVETEYALGAAMPALYDHGWWTTGLLGPVGACAASTNALGLDAHAAASALGLAIAGTGGAKVVFGTDGKPLLAGRASEAGVIATWLAARGAGGPHDAVESDRGFAKLLNNGRFEAPAIDALGTRWRLLSPGIDVKRIPVCLSAHAAVDATLELVAKHGLDVAAMRKIVCDVPPIVAANLRYRRPESPRQAQFSLPFAIAASLVFGDLDLDQLDDAVIADPRVRALMERVDMATGQRWDEALCARAPEGAHVRIELDGGEAREAFCGVARGCASRPLTASEIDAKFRKCVSYSMLPMDPDAVLRRIRTLEHENDVRTLMISV